METKKDKILVVGIANGKDGYFTMDRNIEEKPPTKEELEIEKRKAALEDKYKKKYGLDII